MSAYREGQNSIIHSILSDLEKAGFTPSDKSTQGDTAPCSFSDTTGQPSHSKLKTEPEMAQTPEATKAENAEESGNGAETTLYRPDGLDEAFHGETDQETIDKLMAQHRNCPKTCPAMSIRLLKAWKAISVRKTILCSIRPRLLLLKTASHPMSCRASSMTHSGIP